MKMNLLIMLLLSILGACKGQQGDLAFEAVVAKDSLNPTTYYDLEYVQIKAGNLPDSIRLAINQRVVNKCKSLIKGYSSLDPQDSLWKPLEQQTLQSVAMVFFEWARKEPDYLPFYDSLRVDTVFCSKQIVCFRFSNTLKTQLTKQLLAQYVTFDLKTAKIRSVYEDLAVSQRNLEDIIRPYLKESLQGNNPDALPDNLSFGSAAEMGITNEGLLVHFDELNNKEGFADVTIPWAELKGKGILKDSLIFNP